MATYVNKDAHGSHYACIIQVSFADHSQNRVQIIFRNQSDIQQTSSEAHIRKLHNIYYNRFIPCIALKC